MIGDALGNYRLVAQIGSGSMGLVFLAEHQRISRRVAIKLLAPPLVRDDQALQRFFNEARATSVIRHPGIVEVFDCDVDPMGRAYIVLEHLEGETLDSRMRQAEQLHWSAACLIARRVADALAAAHEKGIVHRDLKPENIFLVGNGRDPAAGVKVLDFGVAKLLASEVVARLTMRGALIGTPEYMSPEQCAGAEVDHRADIYALGCILFEMLAGQPPFVTSTIREMVLAHRFRPAPSPEARCSDLPEWLADLLARMLAKEPDRRPQSMHEVSRALYQYKTQRWTRVAPSARVSGPRVQRPVTEAARGRAAAMVRWLRGRRKEAKVSLVVMVVLAGAVWAVRRNEVVVRPPGDGRRSTVARQTPRGAPAPPAVIGEMPTAGVPPPRAPVAPLPTADTNGGSVIHVDQFSPVRKPEQPVGRARRAPSAPKERSHATETDGIVDL